MGYLALLFCSDAKTAQIVEKVLGELEFATVACNETFAAVKRITTEHFDALVVDCNNEQDATLLFKSARNSALNHSSLAVALVEGQAGIAKAFRIGANLVLSKPINTEQSKSTLRVARGLLKKAEAAKTTAGGHPVQSSASPVSGDAPPSPSFDAAPDMGSLPFSLPLANVTLSAAPVAAAGLEIEAKEEPAPALGAAEAALLESMPDPLTTLPAPGLGASKTPSWQPASKPLAKPPFTQAAEAAPEIAGLQALRQSPPAQGLGTANVTETSRATSGSSLDGLAAGNRAATGIAPAKEIPGAATSLYDGNAAASSAVTGSPALKKARGSGLSTSPAKLRLDVQNRDLPEQDAPDPELQAPGRDSSKKNFLIAAVLVLGITGAGYFAWPLLPPAIMNLGMVQKYLGAKPTQVPASTPAPAVAPAASAPVSAPASASPAPSSGTASQPATAAASATATQTQAEPPAGQVQVQPPASASPVASGQSEPANHADSSARPSPSHPVTQPPAPLVVKSDVRKPSSAAQLAPPSSLDIASNSSDKAVAGVMSTPVLPAKPVLQVVRVSQGVSNGLLIRRIQPIYPTLALQLRVEGVVELEATVNKDGSTSNIKVLKGDGMLATAAVEAVKRWKYKPYYLDGQPVQLQTQITVNFKLPL